MGNFHAVRNDRTESLKGPLQELIPQLEQARSDAAEHEAQFVKAHHLLSLFGSIAIACLMFGLMGAVVLGSTSSVWFWPEVVLASCGVVYSCYRYAQTNRKLEEIRPLLLDDHKLTTVLGLLELLRIDFGDQLTLQLELSLRPTAKTVYGPSANYKEGEEVETWLTLKGRLPDQRRLSLQVQRAIKRVVSVVKKRRGDRLKLKGHCRDRIEVSLSPSLVEVPPDSIGWPAGFGLWNVQELPESKTRKVTLLTPRARFGGARRDREIGPGSLTSLKRLQAALVVLLRL